MWITTRGDDMLPPSRFGPTNPGKRPVRNVYKGSPQGRQMADAMERRRTPRYGPGGAVRIIVPSGQTLSGTIQNVSQDGMLVALSVEVELGRTYEIEVTDSRGSFRLNGEPCGFICPRGRAMSLVGRSSGLVSNLSGWISCQVSAWVSSWKKWSREFRVSFLSHPALSLLTSPKILSSSPIAIALLSTV